MADVRLHAMGSRTAVTIDPGIAHISGQTSALLTDNSLHSWPACQQTAALNLMLSSGAGSDLMMLDMPWRIYWPASIRQPAR